MIARLPSYRVRFLHLTTIWAFGVTQPVFAIVDGNPDLLLQRDATRASVALFAVLVAVIPPALMTGYAWVAGRISPWIGDMLYLVAFGAFLIPLAARVVKRIDFGVLISLGLVGAVVAVGVVVYLRSRAARLFVGYAIALPVLSLAWFVHGLPPLSENAEAAQVRVASPAPVVFILFDELPASSLMTRDGQIDAVRYPNFARLARESTWYPNATTVREWSADAVPAMLTGRVGEAATIPILHNHPENLFTLLGGAYTLDVHEGITRLCPKRYCPRATESALENGYGLVTDSINLLVPRVFPESLSGRVIEVNSDVLLENGKGSKTLRGYGAMLGAISRAESDNFLFFSHVELPHAPWRFFPSGIEYDPRHFDGWLNSEHWMDDSWLTLQGYQRHLLQVGYVDSVLGRALRTLDRNGLYDRSLVIVLADHGAGHRAGLSRREVAGDNLADIANIPLFVKYPNQEGGKVDPRPARSVDLVPTIADVLGIELTWTVDGVSLRGDIPADRGVLVVQREGKTVREPLEELLRTRESTLRHKDAEFGEGHDSLFRIGSNKWLLGRDVAAVERTPADVRVVIADREKLLAVRRASGFVPARISGEVVAGEIDRDTEVAVAVNGRVQALTRAFWDDGTQRIRALVPETALRDGANEVEVFLVRGRGPNAALASVGATSR